MKSLSEKVENCGKFFSEMHLLYERKIMRKEITENKNEKQGLVVQLIKTLFYEEVV